MPVPLDQSARAVPADDAGSDSSLQEHLFVLQVSQCPPWKDCHRELLLLLSTAEIDYSDYVDYGDDGDDR